MSSLSKGGGRECAQSSKTLLLTGWLREVCEKYDKFYQIGRDCIEKIRGSVEFLFTFSFVICCFLANSWVLRFSPSRRPFSSLSLVLGCSLVIHLILDLKFKLCAFRVINVLIKGEIENQVVCALIFVCDEQLTWFNLNLNSVHFS
jgi:hypothetical protein